jgi:hypothetical protein
MKNISMELKNRNSNSYFIGCLDPPRAGVLKFYVNELGEPYCY